MIAYILFKAVQLITTATYCTRKRETKAVGRIAERRGRQPHYCAPCDHAGGGSSSHPPRPTVLPTDRLISMPIVDRASTVLCARILSPTSIARLPTSFTQIKSCGHRLDSHSVDVHVPCGLRRHSAAELHSHRCTRTLRQHSAAEPPCT